MTFDREAVRARCEAATEGPWTYASVKSCTWIGSMSPDGRLAYQLGQVHREINAEFIAHARTDLPAALDALDAKDAEIERLEQQAVRWEAMYEGMMAERDGLTEDVECLEGECKRLRGDRRDALRALVYACHSGGMALNEYVPACLLDDAMERERRVDAALEGRD